MDPNNGMQSDIPQSTAHYLPVVEQDGGGTEPTRIKTSSYTDWADTLWGLIVHGVLSVGIVMLIIFYVRDRPFTVGQHRPPVRVIEDAIPLPFTPRQSDIVTVISGIIVVQKWALAAWVAPLCWRIAIFLMEKQGLPHRDLKALIKYKLLKPRAFIKDLPTFLIGTLLLTSLAASLSSPILTGSLSWIPTNLPLNHFWSGTYWFGAIEHNSLTELPPWYRLKPWERDLIAMQSVGQVAIGWGRADEKNVFKRVSNRISDLAIGSVFRNVTLPYFSVDLINWINNENDIPSYGKNRTIPDDRLSAALDWTPSPTQTYTVGHAALFPTLPNPTNWSSDPLERRTISETRLLGLWLGSNNRNITHTLPRNTYIEVVKWVDLESVAVEDRYAFAWVTFRAGVCTCTRYRCIVSANSTVSTIQNDPLPDLEPHELTYQALSMASSVAAALVNQNSSIPSPWEDINAYVEAVLVRSYSGAWNELNDAFSNTVYWTEYLPALQVLLAEIDYGRVYGWLGLQLFVTLLGSIFLILFSRLSKFPLIGDTALTAFYLDTTDVSNKGKPNPFKTGELKIDQEDGHRMTIRWRGTENASAPYLWSDINDYVEAILVPSYSGAWSTLNSGFQTSAAIARYIPSIPSLLADVNHPRVYTWFGIQILVTLSSALFLVTRFNLSRYSQLEDTTLTAFYLNTMEIPSEENKIQLRDGLLKIELEGDRLKVKLE